ncbi:MAG TPA: glycerophosphoryl diester phosphodiesterase membrane domain-containing protein [Acidimicrobiales bacterium]|nr:glycerophosphoryl diester phosphodiesterase membrane domain-containing protein [Acidimicrobiales bacterium]
MQSPPTSRFRPLSATEIISQGFEAYRRLFRQLVAIPIVLSGIAGIVMLAVLGVVWYPVLRRVHTGVTNGVTTIRYSGTRASLVVPFVVLGVVVLLYLLLQLVQAAALVAVVGQGYVGSRPDWRSALRLGLQRARSILWVLVLISLLFVACGALLTVLSGLVVAVHLGPYASLLFLLVFAAGVYVAVSLSLVLPIVVLERRHGAAVVGRSFQLVRGRFWGTFGALLLAGILAGVVSLIMQFVIGGLGSAGVGGSVLGLLVSFVVELLLAPWLPIITAFLFFDLKNRKEGGVNLGEVAANLGLSRPGSPAAGVAPQGPPRYPPPGYPPPTPPSPGPPPPWNPPASPPPPWNTAGPSAQPGSAPAPSAPQPPPTSVWPAVSPKPPPPRISWSPPASSPEGGEESTGSSGAPGSEAPPDTGRGSDEGDAGG